MTETPARDRVEPVDLQQEMQRSYIDYAMSVIVGRALPEVRDGLKPVHRRVLYAMYDQGFRPDRSYVKCARVVGEVMGNYHPHGDTSIYDALVRLAQPWSMRYPLVDGQGNFGSPGNDPAAAMRYTEARLTPLAMEMLANIDEETVDFQPNYDGKNQEPLVLPGRIPNLLINGSAGIAVGMATNMPPHNLREVAAAVFWVLEHPDAEPEEALTACMERVKGPDFPTHGLIVGREGIEDAYRTGRGSVRMRAVVTVEEDSRGRVQLVCTELPYQVNPDNLAEAIAEAVKDGRLQGISEIADESSDRVGRRLVITLRRDAVAKVVLNNLYKHTQLQTTFGCNMLSIVDGVPRTLRLDELDPALREPPDRGHPAAHPVPAAQGRGARAHPARLRQGARPARRRHHPHPQQRVGRRRPRRADGAPGHRRDPGDRDPGHAAAPAGRPRAPADPRRAGRDRGSRSPTCRRSSTPPSGSGRSSTTSWPRSSRSTATTAARSSSPTTATCRWRTSSRRRRSSSPSPAPGTRSGRRATSTARSAAAARA